jgi:molybdate/tungstate transport system substrate-binding protein
MRSQGRQFFIYSLVLFALLLPWHARAQTTCDPGTPQLIIYHAGSLTAAFTPIEKLFTQQTGICVIDVAAGSVDAARQITAGGKPCDIYASADSVDIDALLKPEGYADYNILFGQGAMVLAYSTASKNAPTISSGNVAFAPPSSIPDAAPDWYAQLIQTGVLIGGSNPFLDPSGYRSDLIFQLAEGHYGVPNLYDTLLGHYTLTRATDALGKTFDYQFTYAHSALAAYKADTTNTYRYVKLPANIGLSDPAQSRRYAEAAIVIPGLHLPDSAETVRIPGTRVTWGLTILATARNPDNAIKFLQLLFGSQGVTQQAAVGPDPISPPIVSSHDFANLPDALRPLVSVQGRHR